MLFAWMARNEKTGGGEGYARACSELVFDEPGCRCRVTKLRPIAAPAIEVPELDRGRFRFRADRLRRALLRLEMAALAVVPAQVVTSNLLAVGLEGKRRPH